MKKFSFRHATRLLLAFLCIVAGFGNADAALYVLGKFTAENGTTYDWNPTTAYQMSQNGNVYTATIYSSSEMEFRFITVVAGNNDSGGWNYINQHAYASSTNGTYLSGTNYGTTQTLNGEGNSQNNFKLAPGKYVITANTSSKTVKAEYAGVYLLRTTSSTSDWAYNTNNALTKSGTNTYTISGVSFNSNNYFVLSCNVGSNWGSSMLFTKGSDQVVNSGTTYDCTLNSSGAYQIPSSGAGNWDISFNASTGKVTATKQTSNKTATIYIYDPNHSTANSTNNVTTGGSTFNASSVSTINGLTWQKVDVSLASSSWTGTATIASNSKTLASQTIADGGTYYYAYDKFTQTISKVTSSYEPKPDKIYLVHWSSDITSSSYVELTTSDGVNYTASGVTIPNGNYFVFGKTQLNAWNSNDANRYSPNNGDETISATVTKTATQGGSNAYKIGATGTWAFTFNLNTLSWTATLTPATTYTYNVYVRNSGNNNVPNLWVYNANDLTPAIGNWPGYAGSTTEVVNGYTFYKFTFTSTSNQVNLIANVNGDDHKTSEIANVQPGNYYIVFDASGENNASITPSYASTTAPGNPTLSIAGSWDNWTLHAMTLSGGNYTWTASSSISTGSTFKFVYNDGMGHESWLGDAMTVSIDENTFAISGNNGNDNVISGTGALTFTVNAARTQCTVTGFDAPAGNAFTVYVEASSAPHLYAWVGESTTLNGGWPGSVMTTTETVGGRTFYKKVFRTTEDYVKLIFNNGQDGDNKKQTGDIKQTDAVAYYTYNGETTYTTLTPTEFTIYVRNMDQGTHQGVNPHVYTWYGEDSNKKEYTGAWGGTQGTVDTQIRPGETWYKTVLLSFDPSVNIIFNIDGDTGTQTGTINQMEPEIFYEYYPSGAEPRFDYDFGHLLTGELYIIGKADGNGWSATTGIKMTKDATANKFTAHNIQLTGTSGTDGFGFTAKLGSNKDDWATVNAYRIMPKNSNGSYQVNANELGTALYYQPYTAENCNWYMGLNGRYDIEVDLDNKTLTITKSWESMYMIGGLTYAGTAHNYQPNDGVEMQTADGNIYTLSGVTLNTGTTFNFSKVLAANNDQGGWDYIKAYRIGAPGDEATEIGNNQLDIAMPTGEVGNGGNATFQDFIVTATASNARYLVTLNVSAKTVRLTQMSGGTNNMIVRLEKTDNVKNPAVVAWDKVKDADPTKSPITVVPDPNYPDGYTTGDGRQWWSWEVENAIADFYFTRSNGSVTQSETLWRRAGVVYYTWEDPASAETEDETRNYAGGAANGVPGCATMLEGHYYVYFINTPGWDNVFCHAWLNGTGTLLPKDGDTYYSYHKEYPGVICELVGYDDDGYEVYRFDFTEYFGEYEASQIDWSQVGVIFNNGVDNKEGEMKDYSTGTGVSTTLGKGQSGDFTYRNGGVYDYLGMLYTGNSLGNLIANGIINGPLYSIDDQIEVVYFDRDYEETITVDGVDHVRYGALFCKDMDAFFSTPQVEKSVMQPDEVDYMMTKTSLMSGRGLKRYDQSNWVRLVLSTSYNNNAGLTMTKEQQLAELAKLPVGSILKATTVWGQLVNNVNPEMHVSSFDGINGTGSNSIIEKQGTYSTKTNVFITGGFLGSQTCSESYYDYDHNDRKYFFVTPKPCEVAHITWSVYDPAGNMGEGFYAPVREYWVSDNNGSYWHNEDDLNGFFPVDWSMLEDADQKAAVKAKDASETLHQAYSFDAVIMLRENSDNPGAPGAPMRAEKTSIDHNPGVTPKYDYVVYPLNINATTSVVTGVVKTVEAAKTVKSVRYYNAAGVESATPFSGVNIVVKEFTDGSRSTTKVLR